MVGPVDRDPSRLPGDDDELPLGTVLFHEAMGLDDLVQPKNSPDLNAAVPSLDLADEVLKRSPHKILGTASVGCQADGGRDGFHRREMLEVPFVADHPGHADDTVPLDGLKGVEQRCGPDETPKRGRPYPHAQRPSRERLSSNGEVLSQPPGSTLADLGEDLAPYNVTRCCPEWAVLLELAWLV